MLSKNIYAVIILLFCSSAHCAELKNFYVRGGYFGAFGNAMGDFSGKEEAGNVTEKVMSFNSDEEFIEGYEPKYTPGFAGSGTIGYQLNALQLLLMLSRLLPSRIEIEGLYSQLNLDDEEYGDKDKAGYVELVRSGPATLAAGDMTPSAGTTCDSKWKTITSPPCNLRKLLIGNDSVVSKLVGTNAAFKIKDEGFHNRAMLMSVYYDLNINPYLVPYVGGGLGFTQVKFLGKSHYAPAYQLKLGASYRLAEKAQIFAGLRYFGIFNDEFASVLPITKIPAGDAGTLNNVVVNDVRHQSNDYHYNYSTRIASTTATINHRFGVYGLEIGMVYNF
ncbi:P44/Msp2 family outer membrane protein [Candidatus Mesenet endosymbiont of Phosphuga atrata]|uniref:P44/Msp2 family outer membrane protein n=1 Tax=Candidatus Mesenet endosymbiont of Phosphuga atrata TaxID=3066221 RepID=UPI0030CE4AFB